jgi:hypothetical protein
MRALCGVLIVLLLSGCAAPIAPTSPTASPSPGPLTTLRSALPATLLAADSPSPAPPATLARLVPRQINGNLFNQITRLEDEMPRANSQGFVVPTDAAKIAFAEIVENLEAGRNEHAIEQAAENGYELVQYTDHGDANTISLLLRELRPIHKGWGLYAFRTGSTRDVIVEAPHPLFDEGTPVIAAQIYRALQGRALLIAGAHRHANADDSADAAHQAQSIFEAIHESLTKSDQTVIVQVHGFASSKHAGYPSAILNTAGTRAPELVERLAEALRQAGVSVGVCDGRSWAELCGETNVQAQQIGPATFIHLELDESVRANPTALVAALRQVLP